MNHKVFCDKVNPPEIFTDIWITECLRLEETSWRHPVLLEVILPKSTECISTISVLCIMDQLDLYSVLNKRDHLPPWLNYSLTVHFRLSELIFSFSFVLNVLTLQGSRRSWQEGWDVLSSLLHKRYPWTSFPPPSLVLWYLPEQISLCWSDTNQG